MSEDFIRLYIGNISLITLRNVQQRSAIFDDWELMQGSDFQLRESYGYQQIFGRDEVLIEAMAKRSVIAENRQPEKSRPSLIWTNALLMADVLTLLSLARAQYYPTLLIEKKLGENHSISFGRMPSGTGGNQDIVKVKIGGLGRFISEAVTSISQNPNWLRDSGFIPSIWWYELALKSRGTAPTIFEVALYWVSLEIVASTHVNRHQLNMANKKERVRRFVTDKGYTGSSWDFLNEVIDDWYKIRCFAFHEGMESLPVLVRNRRCQQARDFTSLVLVEMLQHQDQTRKEVIAAQMQNY